MGNSNDYLGGNGPIQPALPGVNNSMGLAAADLVKGFNIPTLITNEGDFLEVLSNVHIKHYDDQASANWTALITGVQALANRLTAIYWDKVDNVIYMLTYDTVNSLARLGSVNTGSGAITPLGTTFASLVLDAAPDFANVSMTRTVQGTGNLLVSVANTTGLGSIEIPIVGGSETNVVSNILLGNVEPKVAAPYRIDANLYVGGFNAPKVLGTAAAAIRPLGTYMSLATSKGQQLDTSVRFSGGVTMGGYIIADGVGSPCYVREWGDDVALVAIAAAVGRVGIATYNKADFHRMCIDIAVANGLRSS